jgi:hypothetical protein
MRELADRPDPRKKLPTPHAPRRTVHVRPSKAKKKGEQGDSVLTSVFRDGTDKKPRGEYRFIPDDVKAWAAAGFPPAAEFKAWKDLTERRARKAG